jgi:cytochrome c-type biogenesis protein CcmH
MERRVATPDPARRVKARLNRRRAAGLFLGAVLLAVAGTAVAAVFEPREFASAEEERRYKALTNELRCLVCQNQNIADSNAELASDLRELAYQMISQRDSDEQLIAFMVDRYGEFVLYRPRMKASTVALWLGPFLLGAGGVWLLWRMIHRRSTLASTVQDLTDDEKSRLKHLLAGDEVDAKGERDT